MQYNFPFTISQVVAAADGNMAIGRDGALLWHLPQDLRYFKNLTWGMPVIMGRKTFDSIGKPLPGRTNIVLSNSRPEHKEGILHAGTLADAFQTAAKCKTSEVFVIGGGEIYKASLPFTQRIYLTRVFVDILDADTFYPLPSSVEWSKNIVRELPADEKNAHPMQFEIWERMN